MAVSKDSAITPGSWVLVTGVNGFIGSHVANELLIKEFNVRGTVRDTKKASWVEDIFEKKYGKNRYEAAIVKDLFMPNAYDEAMKGKSCLPTHVSQGDTYSSEGVEGVVHVASDMSLLPDPNMVVSPVVAGTISILESAVRELSVRRFVLTSSSMAAMTPDVNKTVSVDQSTWNEETIKDAWAPPPYEGSRVLAVYGASKTQGEREAWKFMKERKPNFVFNAVLPATNFGPSLDWNNQFGSTAGMARLLYQGNHMMEILSPQYFVDVRDCARLHVAALIIPEVQNERIFPWAEPWSKNDLFAIWRRAHPEHPLREDYVNEGHDTTKIDTERGAELLRALGFPGWTSLEQSARDTVEGL